MTTFTENESPPHADGWLRAIESILNRTLELDGLALAAIGQLGGKVVAIELRESGIRVFLTLHEHGIRLGREHEGAVDVSIRGSIPDVLRYLLAARSGGVAGDFEISGEAGLAGRLQEIFSQMEPDWEEAAARRIGDTAARKLGILFQSARTAGREARRALGMDFSEYLRFEKGLVPERGEVDRFQSSVDVLRDDVARLKFRLDRLARRSDH